jgi:hypothetical protein
LNHTLICNTNNTDNVAVQCNLQSFSGTTVFWPPWLHCSGDQSTGNMDCGETKQNIAVNLIPPSCPTFEKTLIMFAVVNIVVSFLGMAIGYRPLVHSLTCKIMGKPERSLLWTVTWIPIVGLQLAASAAIGAVIRSRPGYGHMSITQLMLLYTARPRLSWLFLVFANMFGGEHSSATASAFIAEFILQGFATYPLVSTLMYTQNQLGGLTINYSRNPQDAYIMSAGAFLFMFWVFPAVLCALFLAIARLADSSSSDSAEEHLLQEHEQGHYGSKPESTNPQPKKHPFRDDEDWRFAYFGAAVCVLPTMYLGSWLFWAGFLKSSQAE